MINLFKIIFLFIFLFIFLTQIAYSNSFFSFQIPKKEVAQKNIVQIPKKEVAQKNIVQVVSKKSSRSNTITTASSAQISHDVKKMKGKENYAHVVMVLDSSGSMTHIRNNMVDSCKSFFELQLKIKGEITLDIWAFDSREGIRKIVDFKRLENKNYLKNYQCKGGTPCYDAIIEAVESTEKRIKKLKDKCKIKHYNPERLIFVILTDGADSGSSATPYEVSKYINKHSEEWNFLLLGVGHRMSHFGKDIGLPKENCFDVIINNPTEVKILWGAINEFVKRSRE